MKLENYSGKRVVILGLARQGKALVRFFAAHGARVTVSDVAPAERLAAALDELAGFDVRWVLGGHPLSLLDGCDLLCLSGGVPTQIPLVRVARERAIPLSNDALLTIDLSPAPVIAITGSSGKTTTTTLAGLMLVAGGYGEPAGGQHPCVWVGGNIGTPLVDQLARVMPDDWLALELSSFQLELFDRTVGGRSLSPQVAAVLNVTPNHLDRHPSLAQYTACKANILRWQGPADIAVLGADDAVTGRWLREGRVAIEPGAGQPALAFPLAGRRLGFGLDPSPGDGCWLAGETVVLRMDGRERRVMAAAEVRLPGLHNLRNILAACTVAAAAGVDPEAMAEVARTFSGVAHRLEVVRAARGVRWINDSIATTPERAVAALRSYDEPVILLAGGRDKKLPWDEFAGLVQQRVKRLVVFGEAASLIAAAVAAAPGPQRVRVSHCADLPAAVAEAARWAVAGDVVLLAPGGTSFDAYRDFEARGQHFRDLVDALADPASSHS